MKYIFSKTATHIQVTLTQDFKYDTRMHKLKNDLLKIIV